MGGMEGAVRAVECGRRFTTARTGAEIMGTEDPAREQQRPRVWPFVAPQRGTPSGSTRPVKGAESGGHELRGQCTGKSLPRMSSPASVEAWHCGRGRFKAARWGGSGGVGVGGGSARAVRRVAEGCLKTDSAAFDDVELCSSHSRSRAPRAASFCADFGSLRSP